MMGLQIMTGYPKTCQRQSNKHQAIDKNDFLKKRKPPPPAHLTRIKTGYIHGSPKRPRMPVHSWRGGMGLPYLGRGWGGTLVFVRDLLFYEPGAPCHPGQDAPI